MDARRRFERYIAALPEDELLLLHRMTCSAAAPIHRRRFRREYEIGVSNARARSGVAQR